MIWRPRKGQSVELRYRKSVRELIPYHGCLGTIVIVGIGPGPINSLVELTDGRKVCVPRGNLFLKEEPSNA